jgi:hypothetical protein
MRHGNLEKWRHGDIDLETWKYGNAEIETWTWRHGIIFKIKWTTEAHAISLIC